MVSLVHTVQAPTALPTRRKVVGLARVSSVAQSHEDRGGIPRQLATIKATIERQNLDCLRIYEIADSGTDVLRNPTILEILKMVRAGVVTGLVVADLDRLFRPDQPTDYGILQVFKDTGAIIYSGDTEYNLQSKDSALFANIRSAISGFELALMRERQQGACEAKRKAGRCPTNRLTLPLGVSYDRPKERFCYNEDIAKVIEIFRLFDSGLRNYRELARRFGLANVTVRQLLRNPIYTGWRVIDSKRGPKVVSKTGKSYRKKVKRPQSEVIRVCVIETPAVSQEVFDRVQEAMKIISFNHHESRSRDQAVNLAAGIAKCGYCGLPLFVSSGKRRNRQRRLGYATCKANYYLYKAQLGGCRQPNLPQPELDELVEKFTVAYLTNPKTLTAIISDAVQRSSNVLRMFPAQPNVKAELDALKRREARLLDAMEAGDITLDEFRTRRSAIRQQIAEINGKKETSIKQPATELEEFARLIVRGAMRLKRLTDPFEKKGILQALFSEVLIKDRALVGFRLRDPIPGISSESGTPQTHIILDQPFRVSPPEIPIPEGHRLCSRCNQIKPYSSYYPHRGQCRECLKDILHASYERRKAPALTGGPGRPSRS